MRLLSLVRLEILFAARDGTAFDRLSEQLGAIRAVSVSGSIVRAAEAGMRALAHRSAGAHRIPIIDYLVAAAAQHLGSAVIHYDADYDTLSEVMGFESVWLAPAGSLA